MSLTFVVGRSGTGKSTCLFNRIIEESQKNPDINYLIIVPEQFTMAIQQQIVRLHPAHCVMNIDILSFNRLAYRVFDEIGLELREALADTGKNMVIRKIVENESDILGAFGRNYNKQGFISEIKSFISEMYQYGITPEYIENFIQDNPNDITLVKKLREILIIYKEFEKFLGERYITAEGISDMLARVIGQSQLIRDSVVFMDCFTGFTPSQIGLVTQIMKLSQRTYVSLTMDSAKQVHNETSLFYLTYRTKENLTKIALSNNVTVTKDILLEVDEDKDTKSNELRFLEANIFRYSKNTYMGENENIHIASMSNLTEEMGYVADEIEKLVSGGYRYSDIAVVCGDMEGLCGVASQEFGRRGIPCFIDHKKKIKDNPYIEFIEAVMEIAKTSYSYDSMFRFIRCPLCGVKREDADILENYALAAGINSKSKWKKVWSSQFRINYENRMEQINEVRSYVWEMTKDFSKRFKEQSQVQEYVVSLKGIIEEFECGRKLACMADNFEKEGEYSYEKEYEKVYDEVEKLFEQMKQLLGDVVVSLDEFIKIFEAGVAEIKIGVIPQTADHVTVGDIERSRLNDVKVLFMVGANDSVIPRQTGNGGIMSEIERERMLELGFEMSPTRRQAAFIGNFYLYSNMTKPSDMLYISYSRMSDDARQASPSFIISHILKLFPNMEIISERELMRAGGYEYLMGRLAERERKELDDKWKEVLSWNLVRNRTEKIEKMIDAAFDDKTDSSLALQTARQLYEDDGYSISRVEKYASCAYAHFLRYGLSLAKRDEYEIMLPDMGIIFHEIMQNFSDGMNCANISWRDITRDVCDSMIEECVKKVTDSFENGILHDSSRNKFMIGQIERIAKRTGWTLCRHVAKGEFVPVGYEVKFVKGIGDDESAGKMTGVIDRIDVAREGDNTLVKIIDYKSSDRQFETALFREGISMQLIVYMEAAVSHAKNIKMCGTGSNSNGTRIPAGAFYYKFDDPIVESSKSLMKFDGESNRILFNDDKIDEEIEKKLKMSGIVNEDERICGLLDTSLKKDDKGKVTSDTMTVKTDSDAGAKISGVGIVSTEEFRALMDYSSHVLDRINNEIKEGIVARNPYSYGKKNACEYCEFSGVCRYDNVENNRQRVIEEENFNSFVERIMKDAGEEQKNGVD